MGWWSGLSAATQGGLLSAGGSLLSGLLTQRSANKQMQAQADSSRDQYQRAVADMKAAGLNPMLATKLGGNAAISGAMATFPDMGQAVTRGAQAELNSAQAAKSRFETSSVLPQQVLESIQRISESASRISVNDAQKQQIFRSIDKIGAEIETMASTRALQVTQQQLNMSQSDINGVIYGLKRAELPAAWAVETFWNMLDEKGLTEEAKVLQFFAGLEPLLKQIPGVDTWSKISKFFKRGKK